MSSVIRSLMVKIGVDLTGVQKGLKQTAKEFSGIGKTLSTAGGTLTRTLTVPILGAVGALGAIVVKSASAASALQRMSGVTGLGTERLQELTYVGAKLDVQLDAITGTQRSLVKAMTAAQSGADSQQQVFQRLGVSVVDSSGHLRDSNVVFGEAIDALGRMTNPAERDAMALKVFGRNALALNPLIKVGSAEIARLTAEARANGAVLSGSSIKALDRFKTSLDALKLSLSTASSEIAMALLPIVNQLVPLIRSSVVPAIRTFAEWLGRLVVAFQNLSPGMQRFVLVLAGMTVGIGPALSSIGSLYTGIASLLKLFSKMTVATLGMSAALLFLVASIGFLALVVSETLNPMTTSINEATDVVGGIGTSSSDASAGANALANGLDNVTTAAKSLLSLAGFDEINQLGRAGSASPLVGDLNDTLEDLTRLQSSLDGLTIPVLEPIDMASLLGLSGLVGFVRDWNAFWEGVGGSIYDFVDKAARGFDHLRFNIIPGLVQDVRAVFGITLLLVFLKVRDVWQGIQTAWSTAWANITATWATVKAGWQTSVSGIFASFAAIPARLKTIASGIGTAIKTGLNAGIDALNGFITKLNNFKIKLPAFLGGGTVGFDLPLIPRFSIESTFDPATFLKGADAYKVPQFAQGGIIGSPTMAMVGEYGREAILPLERNTGWIDELARRLGALRGGNQPAAAGGVSVYIGNEKLDGYVTRVAARTALRSNGR